MKVSILMAGGGDILRDGHRARAFNWVRKRWLDLVDDHGCELVIGTSDHEPYNRSAARNDAFKRSSGEMLIVADADTVPQTFAIEQAVELVLMGAPWVIPYGLGRYYNLSQDASRRILERDPLARMREPVDPDEWEHKLDSWAGMQVLPRGAWEAVGGYDEEFIGWGYDDNAFRAALDSRVGTHVRCDGLDAYALHLWHARSEAENFGQPFIEQNRRRYQEYERGLRP